jgi:hypothetical protein
MARERDRRRGGERDDRERPAAKARGAKSRAPARRLGRTILKWLAVAAVWIFVAVGAFVG